MSEACTLTFVDGSRWTITSDMFGDGPLVVIPISQLEHLSDEDIGVRVRLLAPQAQALADEALAESRRQQDEWIAAARGTRSPPPSAQIGHVYLLQCGPFYKIGKAVDVNKRVKDLRTQPPFDIELLHVIHTLDMRKRERQLHQRFADKRVKGEWFKLDTADVAAIQAMEGDY